MTTNNMTEIRYFVLYKSGHEDEIVQDSVDAKEAKKTLGKIKEDMNLNSPGVLTIEDWIGKLHLINLSDVSRLTIRTREKVK